jgi:hypothetical protein
MYVRQESQKLSNQSPSTSRMVVDPRQQGPGDLRFMFDLTVSSTHINDNACSSDQACALTAALRRRCYGAGRSMALRIRFGLKTDKVRAYIMSPLLGHFIAPLHTSQAPHSY